MNSRAKIWCNLQVNKRSVLLISVNMYTSFISIIQDLPIKRKQYIEFSRKLQKQNTRLFLSILDVQHSNPSLNVCLEWFSCKVYNVLTTKVFLVYIRIPIQQGTETNNTPHTSVHIKTRVIFKIYDEDARELIPGLVGKLIENQTPESKALNQTSFISFNRSLHWNSIFLLNLFDPQ